MKNLISLFVLTLTIVSCSQKEELKTVEVSFDLYGTCELVLLNKSTDSVRIEISNYATIIDEKQTLDTAISENDSLKFEVLSQGYSYFTLVINDYYYRVFSVPKTVIRAEIISDSVINFIGELDTINNYLTKSSGTYYSTHLELMELVNLTGNFELTYEDLMSRNEMILQKHQSRLENNKDLLPKWYFDIETKRLAVLGASFKLSALNYRKLMYKIEDNIPLGYVDSIVEGVPYEDVNLMGFDAFWTFLYSYSSQSFNPLNDTLPGNLKEKYNDSLFAHTARIMHQPFLDYSIASSLSLGLMVRPNSVKPEWIELVTDTVYKNFFYKKFNESEVLPQGAKAPNFTVLDMGRNHFSFSDIKDTVVLINFWASYCRPCFENFPKENELVAQFKNQPVKIINMCIDSDFEMFKVFVEMHELKTFNLFADRKTSSQLREKFDIHGIPHSILIDKNGLVVHNKCTVKGDGIVDEIEGLLE